MIPGWARCDFCGSLRRSVRVVTLLGADTPYAAQLCAGCRLRSCLVVEEPEEASDDDGTLV